MVKYNLSKILEKIYYDPKNPASFSSQNKLFTEAKKVIWEKFNKNITREQVEKWLSGQRTYTLHKPIQRKKLERNPVTVQFLDGQWQADLCDMTQLSRQNDGIKFLLTCIDVLSKYAWVRCLPNKSAPSMIEAFESIFNEIPPYNYGLGRPGVPRIPLRIQTDKGLEFRAKTVQQVFNKYNIKHFSSENDEIKAQVVERFNLTLKRRLYRYMSSNQRYRYIEALPKIVYAYNHTEHRTIKMAPYQVNHKTMIKVWDNSFKTRKRKGKRKKSAINTGDYVLIAKYKHIFEKGYLPSWTMEYFVVDKIIKRRPPVYKLKDMQGEEILGSFLREEIQKISLQGNLDSEWYPIEKILNTRHIGSLKRKRGQATRAMEYLVKFEGWPNKFNQWIPASDVKSLN